METLEEGRIRREPGKLVVMLVLVLGLAGIGYGTAMFGYAGLALGVLPAVLCMGFYAINNPAWTMLGLFVGNYLIMGLSKYFYNLPLGTILDVMILFSLFTLIVKSMYSTVEWSRAKSGLTLAAFIWTIYCCLELFNPNSGSVTAWASSIRSYAFVFLAVVVLSQIVFTRFKHLQYMLVIWSMLTMVAVGKACIQKFIGFDAAENYWLFVLGGRTTHIIHSGARYFSIFSDAANFGASMGLSMVVFAVSGVYAKSKWTRWWFYFVAVAACYGMLISGTRSALAVPFTGFAVFIFLSRHAKVAVGGVLLLVAAFVFLNYTYIGQGNALIRRARSAFNRNDPSYQLRLENQKKLRVLMADKPFGAGLGMGGGKALQHNPHSEIAQIPTDSWFVMVWVETGIVGLLLHIFILLYILGRGAWLIFFRLKDKRLRGLTAGLLAGIAGIVVASYANEIFGQIPTGVIMYISMSFIFLAPGYDRELAEERRREEEARNAKRCSA